MRALLVLMTLCTALATATPYSGGDGSAANPWQIANTSDFLTLSANPTHWNAHFILTADLDLAAHTFTQAPIAPHIDLPGFHSTRFTGLFNGNNKTIRNLTIQAQDTNCIGLVGVVGNGGKIMNLGVVNVYLTGNGAVGGLAGVNDNGTITSCYTTGSVKGNGNYVGGLVGWNSPSATLRSCYSTASVIGAMELADS